ncbi:hypothetical protein [Flagellimonas sp.]|uniref:hypothetical protein n=1 Tax=Flagellimonas sp. TaxID=2058762 RepID=UPI003BAC4707
MKNSNFNQRGSYQQIKEQLDLAITMFDEGAYSASEYETIVNGLKQDFLRLDRKKGFRF